MTTEFSKQLLELSAAAGFTMADMAAWCDCDRGAMREWMKRDVTPHPVKMKYLQEKLDLLRRVLKEADLLPIPFSVHLYQHIKYVNEVKVYAKKLPKAGASKRRL